MSTADPTPTPAVPDRRTPDRRTVVLLGSTGSIGTQALDVVRSHPDRFVVSGLAAGGGRPELLAAQAAEFGVATVAVADPAAAGAASRPRCGRRARAPPSSPGRRR